VKPELTAEVARELFMYDATTGRLFWRVNKAHIKAWTPVGTAHSEGYISVRVNRRRYFAHRIIWLMVTGNSLLETAM